MTGAYEPIAAQGDILLCRRSGEGGALVVALNLGAEPAAVNATAIDFGSEVLLSTFLDLQGEKIERVLHLRGNEGVVVTRQAHSG